MEGDRRDDWHNSVDERLVNLTSAQKSADIDLQKLRRNSEKNDLILRGDPARNKEGLIEAVNLLRNEINKFNRIFDKDYLGHGGLVSFITYVYDRERERDEARKESRGYKWGFWGTILAAAIGAAAIVLTNRDQIEKWWTRPKLAPLEQTIERAKHPRGKKIVRVRVIQEDATDEKGTP